MPKAETDPRITKRRVTMRNVQLAPEPDEDGNPVYLTTEAVDYVPDDDRGLLAPYVADARTRWQQVTVSKEFDAGPGGYDGTTAVPPRLDHELAGQIFPATDAPKED